MNPILSIALMIVGVILLSYEWISADYLTARFSTFFAGHSTDRMIWIYLGGSAALIIGVSAMVRSAHA